MKKVGFAVTGSFCTHSKILVEIEKLVNLGYEVLPILSPSVVETDTRFGTAKAFKENIEKICKNKAVTTIVEAEPIGPNNLIELLVIAPCTGNTLAKIANAITDTSVTMVAKAHLRNNKPLVIGISTNDALGLNVKNLATLLNAKNIYFVPMGQDNFDAKPKSLICDFSLLEATILSAEKKQQLQPLLLK